MYKLPSFSIIDKAFIIIVIMGRMKDIIKYLPLVSQLGLSVIMPILLCVLLCYFLVNRFGVGMWIYIPGFILGIGAGFMTCYKLYKKITDEDKKRKKRVGFNIHE